MDKNTHIENLENDEYLSDSYYLFDNYDSSLSYENKIEHIIIKKVDDNINIHISGISGSIPNNSSGQPESIYNLIETSSSKFDDPNLISPNGQIVLVKFYGIILFKM